MDREAEPPGHRTPFRLTHIAARRGAELKQQHQQEEEDAQQGSHGRRRHQAARASEVASRPPAAQSKAKLAQVGREPEWSGLKGEEEALEGLVCRGLLLKNQSVAVAARIGLFTLCSPVLTQRRACSSPQPVSRPLFI